MEFIETRGVMVPALGLGTWALRGATCREVVQMALELGYRHIDTAQMYGNEGQVGTAVTGSDVNREDIFLTTKLQRGNLRRETARSSFHRGLEAMGLDYVDLLLIHWPNPSVPIPETIHAMNELQEEGTVRHIGVSNFSVAQMRKAADASSTPIITNQVEYHPFQKPDDVLEHCVKQGIMLTAYSPLAKGRVTSNSSLQKIGSRYGKSPSQVALRWLVQQKYVSAIPKSSSREHLEENMEIFDFELSSDEMKQIFALQGGPVERVRSILGL